MLYLLDFHIEYPTTMAQKELFSIWAREADAALGAKEAGVVADLWKCVDKGKKGVCSMESLARGFMRSILLTGILCLVVGTCTINIVNPSVAEAQATTYEGYLADVLCATRGTALDGADMLRHPEKHSVACLKEPQCVASGYGILTKGNDETFTFHKFDKKGNELALELIEKTQKKDSLSVKVLGQMKEGTLNVESIVEK